MLKTLNRIFRPSTKSFDMISESPVPPDWIGVMMLKQIVVTHLKGRILFSTCGTLDEQEAVIFRRAEVLGLKQDPKSIEALNARLDYMLDQE